MIVLFAFGGLLGVFVFAGFIDLGDKAVNSTPTGTVVLWGTVPNNLISPILDPINSKETLKIKYVYKNPSTFDKDLLEAFAVNQAPDLFFVTDDNVINHLNKISITPYASYPLVNFKNNFTSAGEVFLNNKGILAFPILIDPLMMYYNRTLLDSNNIVYPPEYWDQFPDLVKTFTKKDNNSSLLQSTFALGQYNNINNAKNIIVSLFLQNNNEITYYNNGSYRSAIKKDILIEESLVNSLAFYLSFADPLNLNYSWNRSLPNSLDSFSKEELVFYFGFASELKNLLNKNPNHNFGVAPLPQIRDNNLKTTHARVLGIAISANSKNKSLSPLALSNLVSGKFAEGLSYSLGIPPARRDLLAKKGLDSYTPVFYSSALFAKSFIDTKDSNIIFKNMIEEVLSNGYKVEDAINNLSNRFNLLLLK